MGPNQNLNPSPNPKRALERYLKALESQGHDPNFWCSEEYLRLKEPPLEWIDNEVVRGPREPNGSWFLPPFVLNFYKYVNDEYPRLGVWACLPSYNRGVKLDDEFIYNPRDFLEMKGKRWKTFRKNVRRFTRLNGEGEYKPVQSSDGEDIVNLVSLWAGNQEHFDADTMAAFVLEGSNRWGLWIGDELVGLNIWDENYRYVNYRYCFDDGSSYLNEYLRYRFYTSDPIQSTGKLVNDGGWLDRPGLKRFKHKLNPVSVRPIYTYHFSLD